MFEQIDHEYSHQEVVDSLLELVDEGVLEMGVDEDGFSVFWFRDEESLDFESQDSLAVG